MATMNSGLGGSSGYGENAMKTTGVDAGNLDDGSKIVDITSVFGAGGIDFYGSTYTGIYINTNGLITFDGPETAYSPTGISNYSDPAIAPFWKDVDITKGGDIYWDLDTVNNKVTITWDNVAPYTGSGVNSFQVVLTNTGSGDFDIEFIYEDIQWAQIDADGSGGAPPVVAQAGITDGGSNDFPLAGSGNNSAMLNYPTTDFGNGNPAGVYGLSVTSGTVPCFGEGTLIFTERGTLPVEDIKPGDQLVTLNDGLQPMLWVARRHVTVPRLKTTVRLRPVIIRKGALGNERRMVVSQQHAFLVEGQLVRAKYLVDYCGGKVARLAKPTEPVTYYHMLTPTHTLIRAEGAWCETLYPGVLTMSGLGACDRLRLVAALPRLELINDRLEGYGPPARTYATRRDIRRGDVRLLHGVSPDTSVQDTNEAPPPNFCKDQGYRAARHQGS